MMRVSIGGALTVRDLRALGDMVLGGGLLALILGV
jgi:hypothetical protein